MCIRNTCVLEVVTVVLEVSENHHIFTLISKIERVCLTKYSPHHPV